MTSACPCVSLHLLIYLFLILFPNAIPQGRMTPKSLSLFCAFGILQPRFKAVRLLLPAARRQPASSPVPCPLKFQLPFSTIKYCCMKYIGFLRSIIYQYSELMGSSQLLPLPANSLRTFLLSPTLSSQTFVFSLPPFSLCCFQSLSLLLFLYVFFVSFS